MIKLSNKTFLIFLIAGISSMAQANKNDEKSKPKSNFEILSFINYEYRTKNQRESKNNYSKLGVNDLEDNIPWKPIGPSDPIIPWEPIGPSNPVIPWEPIGPSTPTKKLVWVDGTQQTTKEYTNQLGNTLTTTGNNYGLAASGADTKITNKGDIVISSGGGSNPTAGNDYFNTSTGKIEEGKYAGYAFGMVGDSSSVVTNEGTITTDAGGMALLNGASGTNNGIINSTGDIGIYVSGLGTTGINSSTGEINISSSTGNTISGIEVTNSGNVTNEGKITVEGTGPITGIYATNGSKAINKSGGSIIVNGTGPNSVYGMVANGSEIINELGGTITVSGTGPLYGMTATNNGKATNNGDIAVTGANNVHGMYATSGGNVVNEVDGNIEVIGTGSGTGSIYGIYSNNGGNATNKGDITVTGAGTTYGMMANGSEAINELGGNIIVNGTGNATYGMYALSSGGKSTNKGNITVNGSGDNLYGMFAVSGGIVTNELSGNIEITGSGTNSNTYGMYSSTDGTAVNNGKITVNGAGVVTGGMVASGNQALVTNNGDIEVTGSTGTVYGMVAKNGSSNAINNKNIKVTGNKAYGMFAENGGMVTNELGGTLTVEGTGISEDTYGMVALADSTAINNGELHVTGIGTSTSGMVANGDLASVTNNGDIEVTGSSTGTVYGMQASGTGSSTATNNKNITVEGTGVLYGMYGGTNDIIINGANGTINVNGTGSSNIYGMTAEGGSTATNNGTLNVIGVGDLTAGMTAEGGSTATNNGDIVVEGSKTSWGMYATAGSVVNEKNITVVNTVSDVAAGMYIASGGTGTNGTNGVINVSGNGGVVHGISVYAQGSEATNNGIINVTGSTNATITSGMYAHSSATITNNNEINVTGVGTGNTYGMYSTGGSTATNNGIITVEGSGITYGMYAYTGGTIANTGTINVNGTGSSTYGMYTNGNNSSVLTNNDGSIIVNGNSGITYGTYSVGGGSTTNGTTGSIDVTGSGDVYGMYGSSTNEGIINVNGTGAGTAYGIFANNAGTLENKLTGVITVTGTGNGDTYGLYASNSSILNSGSVTVKGNGTTYGLYVLNGTITNDTAGIISAEGTGTANTYGMYAEGAGSTAINNGDILVSGAGDIYGMYSNGGTLENAGDIVLTGTGTTSGARGMVGEGTGTSVINGATGTIEVTNPSGGGNQGIKVSEGATALNQGSIIVNGENSAMGMFATSQSSTAVSQATNEGTITVTSTSGVAQGMRVSYNASITNAATGVLDVTGAGDETSGMYAQGGDIINEGNINVTGTGAGSTYGIFASNANTVENKSTGVITVTGTGTGDTYGLYASNSSILNSGSLTVTGNGITYGTYTTNGTITNDTSGKIIVEGTGSGNVHGMFAAGYGLSTNNGEIAVTGNMNGNSYGMFASNSNGASQAINNGKIEVTGGANVNGMFSSYTSSVTNTTTGEIVVSGSGNIYGMQTSGGNAINEGKITATATGSGATYGIYANNGGLVENKSTGVITVTGTGTGNAYGLYARNSSISNSGSITVKGNGITYGAYVESGQITNDTSGKIIVEGTGNENVYGMYADGGTSSATNNGEITGTGTGTIANISGMYAKNGSSVTNGSTGTINISGASSEYQKNLYGMYADGIGSEAINNGNITTTATGNRNAYGMYASNSGKITNNNDINVTGEYNVAGMQSYGTNASATNNGTITASNTNSNTTNAMGMYGMSGGSITNSVSGSIISNGAYMAYGMYLQSSGTAAQAQNFGDITVNGQSTACGMWTNTSGVITNESGGNIEVTGANTMGMSIYGNNSQAFNNGTIIVNSGNGYNYGMNSTGQNNQITNTGIITLSDGSGTNYGMYSDGSNSTGSQAINRGTIVINGDGDYGMYAKNGGYILNDTTGIIDLRNATNSTGMYGTGSGTTVQNKGTIYLDGDTTNDVVGNDTGATGGTGNIGIVVENGAQLINSGVMQVQGAFNTNDVTSDGSGTFVMADGGTLTADSVSGDIYASYDIVNGYEDIGIEEGAIVTEDMNGNLESNSIMYDASYKEGTSENSYDIVMERNSFYEIMDNQERAAMLENSYYSNGDFHRDDIYNEYKKAQTNDELNNLVSKTLAEDIYPSIQKLTYDIKDFNNEVLMNSVFDNIMSGDFQRETIYIGGFNISGSTIDSSNDFQGYDTTLTSINLGIDRKINSNARYGFVGTVGKGNTEYDDDSELKTDFYQINMYGLYKNSGYEYLVSPYIGFTKGDLDRNIKIGDIKDKTNADADSKYIGIMGQVSKNYKFNIKNKEFYAKPKIFVDTAVVLMDEVSEDSGYGVTTEKNRSTSFITGVGSTVGKEFQLKNDSKIDASLFTTYKHEFGNPTASLDGNANAFEGDVKYNEYNQNKDFGDVGVKIAYKKGELTTYVEYKYEVGQDEDEKKVTAGIAYKF